MKILHYINNLGAGGAEKLLVEILPLMKAKGHEVHLVYLNNKKNVKAYDETLESAGIKVQNLNVSYFNPIQVIYLIQIMKREQYNIVHAHLFPTQYWLALASFFKPKKTKLIKTEHSVFNHRRKYLILNYLERVVYNRYFKIIAITDEVKLSLQTWLKVKDKIEVVHNGIDLEKIEIIKSRKKNAFKLIDSNNINILMTGSFRKAKDQNTLIKSVTLLPNKYHVYFAGDGTLIEVSKKLASELGISDRVHFLGTRTDVISLMSEVDINVLSTHYEGLSGVTLESLASGKPFIGSDVSGVNNIVPNNTYLFPKQDFVSLAKKITEIVENESIAKEMVKTALRYIKKFDIQSMIDNYLKLYSNAIQQ